MDYSKLSQGLGGLLDGNNQLLNIGMGILANNNDGTFGGAVGRGFQQAQTMQQANLRLKQEQELRQMQAKKYQDEALEAQSQREAIERFKLKYPELADSADLDPKAAFKAANPQLNTADPYFKDTYIGGKTYAFDARTGEFIEKKLEGGTLPNKDDPRIQFPVSAAKSAGDNMYEVTDKKDGFLMPMTNLALETGAPPLDFLSPNSAPQAPQQTPPQMQMNPNLIKRSPSSMQIPPAVQGKRDDVRMQILLAEQAAEGGAGRNLELDKEIGNMRGIRVLTKLETKQGEANIDLNKDLAIAQGKANVELNMKPQIEVATATATAETKSAQSAKKGTATLNSMMRYLYKDGKAERDESNRLTPPKDAMLLGNSVPDRALMKSHEYGFTNKKASNVIGVRRLINSLVLDANNGSLGAGVSNSDVEFLQKIQGVINSAQAPEDIYNAIADNEDRFNRILGAKEATEKPIIAKGEKIPEGKGAGVVKIKGDADYNALPSGSAFIDPFGKKRIKP